MVVGLLWLVGSRLWLVVARCCFFVGVCCCCFVVAVCCWLLVAFVAGCVGCLLLPFVLVPGAR